MTYERKIRLTLSIDERVSVDDDDPSPSLPPQPVADAIETTGECVSEQLRPLRKATPVNVFAFPTRRKAV
jgi:hypothetical protein